MQQLEEYGMSKNIIYCFSGTGNCLNLAKLLKKELADLGGDETEIIMMRKNLSRFDATDADRVGFIFPCYAGGAPAGVVETIEKIETRPDAYTFGICSYAAYMGTGLYKINKVKNLDYWNGVPHHCSCIWLLPHKLTMPMLSVEDAQKNNSKKAHMMAKDILGRKYRKAPPMRPLNQVESAAWPMLSVKKSNKLKANPEKCVLCGQCAKLCPRQNIKVTKTKVVFGSDCVGCLGCLQYCPQEAITMGKLTDIREKYHNPDVTVEELTQDVL